MIVNCQDDLDDGFESNYEILGKISHGAQGKIYEVQDKYSGAKYAAKFVSEKSLEY